MQNIVNDINIIIDIKKSFLKMSISTSTYSFEKLIKNNYLYIDKTKYLYKMISVPNGQFFIARPRRFGKSLMISTLEALFQGKRELFKGMYIDNGRDENGRAINYSFEQYPVIHIDMSDADTRTPELLEESLLLSLSDIAMNYDVAPKGSSAGLYFRSLIGLINRKFDKELVLLIDEYDKPLTDNLNININLNSNLNGDPNSNFNDNFNYHNSSKLNEIRSVLESFYSVIKGQEKRLRFTFITGVTKFSQVSIFSKLNNLTDISLSEDAALMFGYTQEELEKYFSAYLNEALANGIYGNDGQKLSMDDFLSEIKVWYDGFRFYPTKESLYNPVSIGNFFNSHCDFGYYWYSTGTPSYLERLAKKQPLAIEELDNVPIPKSVFAEFNIENFANDNFDKVDLMKLLYQTGYLTLSEDKEFLHGSNNPYHLCFPNKEVEEAYMRLLLNAWFPKRQDYTRVGILQALDKGDTDLLKRHLDGFFASIPYELFPAENKEKTYQMMMYILFSVIGEDILVEEHTNIGRIDVVLDGKRYLYVMELKLDKTAEEAIGQIEEREYVRKYLIPAREKGKDIIMIGVNFSSKKKNINSWKVKTIKPLKP